MTVPFKPQTIPRSPDERMRRNADRRSKDNVATLNPKVETLTARQAIVATVPPSSAPSLAGIFYIDTAAPQLYFSRGASSVSDWIAIL